MYSLLITPPHLTSCVRMALRMAIIRRLQFCFALRSLLFILETYNVRGKPKHKQHSGCGRLRPAAAWIVVWMWMWMMMMMQAAGRRRRLHAAG
jgi:hypothetical protein